LFKGRKSSFISIISLVSIIGIAIGVAALIIALSLLNGFQGDIRDKILSSTAHVMVNNVFGEGLADYEPLIKEIQEQFDEVTSAAPVVFGTVLVKGSSRYASGAVLRGVDLSISANELWAKKLESGSLPKKKNQLLMGREIAVRLSLISHDPCTVITPQYPTLPGRFIQGGRGGCQTAEDAARGITGHYLEGTECIFIFRSRTGKNRALFYLDINHYRSCFEYYCRFNTPGDSKN
jgi:ABC-type lipoprotein release transport system permease subunit